MSDVNWDVLQQLTEAGLSSDDIRRLSTNTTTQPAPAPSLALPVSPQSPSGAQLVDLSTGRIAYTGPNGEGGLAANDPRVRTTQGLVPWTMPDGRVAYYVPGQNIQQGNVDALAAWNRTPEEEAPAPTLDFRSEAGALFPWMSGALLDSFAGFWADTGSSTAALGRLRNTAEYDRVFAGIKRPDGTMRMDENAYFSTKAGFREALSEFGKDPAQYESRFVKAIENEMGAEELMRGMADAYQRFFEPGGSSDGGLFDTFLDSFVNSGSAQTALQTVRQSSAYDAVFQGNRREDGTIRMDEQEWFAYKRGWMRSLAEYGLNPEEFLARDRLRASVEGEMSIQELNQRLQATQDGILDNIEQVQNFYGQNYGLEVSAAAILGMAIDPGIQRDILERRITAAQVGGEAAAQGFLRSVDRAEALARMGVSQTQARELYGTAARRLPGISGATQRYNLGATTLTNYEDVVVGQDAAQGLRIERGLQREESAFSRTMDTRGDDFGLSGLRQR